MIVFAIGSYYVTSLLPRVYEATTTLRVGQALESPNPTYQDVYVSQQLAETYNNMASRRSILTGAADALGLGSVPSAKNVRPRIVPNTQFLEISVRDPDPERARIVANAIAQQLVLQSPEGLAEEQARRAFLETQLQDLQHDIQAIRESIQAEQTKLDAANQEGGSPQGEDRITRLQERLASYRATYAALLQTATNRTNDIAVFEAATTPSRPVSPRVLDTVLFVTALGLFLGIGIVFLIESWDDTIKTSVEFSQVTGLPVLGTVSRMRGKGRIEALLTQQSASRIAEDYRTLRTNIQFSSVDRPLRTLVVTSPSLFEGKTTTVANLGIVLAQSGKSVVMVDADLRRPRLHRIFHLPGNSGLTEVLTQTELAFDGQLQPAGIEDLRLLTSGPLPPNPSELLGSQKMALVIEALKAEADLVIFDTPPVLAVTDAAVLASQADGVLLIAEAGKTRRAAAVRALENLQQVGANVVGGVLNKFAAGRSETYYYGDSQVR
jgi:non-specific protein-tyrosine kinase